MGDHDGRDRLRFDFGGTEPALEIAAAEPGVDEDADVACLDERRVAAAAAPQNRDPHHSSPAPPPPSAGMAAGTPSRSSRSRGTASRAARSPAAISSLYRCSWSKPMSPTSGVISRSAASVDPRSAARPMVKNVCTRIEKIVLGGSALL